jgi:hypothetical protein
MTSQENHNLLDSPVFSPGLSDSFYSLASYTVDLAKALGVLLDHVKRLEAELVDHAFGDLRAKALDSSGAQKTAQTVNRGWLHLDIGSNLELLTEPGVSGPFTAQP